MRIDWQPSKIPGPGCYTMTMMITHRSNYDSEVDPKPIDPARTAYLTWWLAYGAPPQDISFEQCPQRPPPPLEP
jgi:hypothetical protein